MILHRDERREFVVDSIIWPLMSDLESYAVGGSCAYFAWQRLTRNIIVNRYSYFYIGVRIKLTLISIA